MFNYRTTYLSLIVLVIVLSSVRAPAQISDDALELTLRVQEGIFLDSLLAKRIDSSLAIARSINDTLLSIHIFPEYVANEILISTSAAWSNAWKKKELWTGDSYIDSIGRLYGLVKVDTLDGSLGYYILTFISPLQIRRLCALYAKHTGVNFAEPDIYIGDDNNIEYFRKNSIDHFSFSRGYGDCPSGCIERYYWYVTVVGSRPARKALLEESGSRRGVKLYRWNIPPRYAMTMFPNVDSILAAIQFAPDWWVRRHAIEGIWRFFEWKYAWVGEDYIKHWDTLKLQAQSRKGDILNALKTAQNDADPDVKTSAEYAVNKLKILNVTIDAPRSFDCILFQNYPNPFNPTTQIQFRLTQETDVTIRVFNILGQESALLVRANLSAGLHSIDWNAERFPSGIYYYTLQAGKYSESKKMLLLK